MKHGIACLTVCACLVALSGAMTAQAQRFGGLSNVITEGTSYHVFAKSGEATVQILVLGTVGSPGIYEVGAETNLGQLVALTGGPVRETTQGRVSRESKVTIRLFREASGQRSLIYEEPLDRLLTEPGLYPSLQDGDVLSIDTIVTERQRTSFRDVLSFVSTLATFALVIERIANN